MTTTQDWKKFNSLMNMALKNNDADKPFRISSLLRSGEWRFSKTEYIEFLRFQSNLALAGIAWNEKLNYSPVKLIIDIDKIHKEQSYSVNDYKDKLTSFIDSTIKDVFNIVHIGPTDFLMNSVSLNGRYYLFSLYADNSHKCGLCKELNSRAPTELKEKFKFDENSSLRTLYSYKSQKGEDGYNELNIKAGRYYPGEMKTFPILKKYSAFNLDEEEVDVLQPKTEFASKWIKPIISDEDQIQVCTHMKKLPAAKIEKLLKLLDSDSNGHDWYLAINALYNLGATNEDIHEWSSTSDQYDEKAVDTINALEAAENRIMCGKSTLIKLNPKTEPILHERLLKEPIIKGELEFFDEEGNSEESNLYEDVKRRFERYNFKCVDESMFYCTEFDTIKRRNKETLKTAYEHIKFVDDKGKEVTFIWDWIVDKNIRVYQYVQLIPPPKICPDNTFNLWNGFAIEKVQPETLNDEQISDLEFLLEHINLLCNKHESTFEYAKNWIAYLFQFPGLKPLVMLLFKTKPGLGKDDGFYKILALIIGYEYCFITQQIERDIVGHFNDLIENKILIALDEFKASTGAKYAEEIKELATREFDSINAKGVGAKKIRSIAHYVSFSNNKFPWKIDNADRRNFAIDSSEQPIPSSKYFYRLRSIHKKPQVLRAFYDLMMNRDLDEWDAKEDRPNTEFMDDLKLLNRSAEEHFIVELLSELKSDLIIKSGDLYLKFNNFKTASGIDYNITKVKFGLNIKHMRNPAIENKQSIYHINQKIGVNWLHNMGYKQLHERLLPAHNID